jgi:LuxR family maltose regulon positive regulatory protein
MRSPIVNEAKLRVPRAHRETIGRRRLTRLLEAAAARPLTVVCAPAGFGKTTALAQWTEAAGRPSAWLSLDAADDDPRRLLGHVVAALQRLQPGAALEAERALHGGSDLSETVLPLLLEALAEAAAPDGLAIVLDDLHLVQEPTCHRLLSALADSLPPQARLVVASRALPPLRLARRRAAGTVAEIGPEALAFRPQETERLLNGALALALRPDQLEAVEERLSGWPVGLALVGASMQAKPDRDRFLQAFGHSRSDLAEYLVEEVLDQLAPELRAFLRRTSILARLNESLCAAVLDDPAAGTLLDAARRSMLFTTTADDADPDGTWVRCHQLFAELLERELRAREPQLVAPLHLRAAGWFEARGRIEEAIAHASAAGDGRRAAALVHRHGGLLMRGRRYATVRKLIDAIPPERGEFGPYCRALHLLAGGLDGTLAPDEMDTGFRALRSDYGAPGVEPLVEQCLVSPFFGRVTESVERGRALHARLRDRPLAARAAVAANVGAALWFAGRGEEAQTLLEAHLAAMVDRHRAWAVATLGLVAADAGREREALARTEAAIAAVEGGGGESALEHAFVYQAGAAVLRTAGLRDDAERALDRAARLTARIPGSLNDAFTLLLRAELQLDGGDRDGARRSAAAARAIVDRYPDPGVLAPRLAAVEAVVAGADTLLGTAPTRAEMRVLALLPSELSRSQIAAALYLSPDTVASHVRRIYRRLGVGSRAEAVAAARARGLLDPVSRDRDARRTSAP